MGGWASKRITIKITPCLLLWLGGFSIVTIVSGIESSGLNIATFNLYASLQPLEPGRISPRDRDIVFRVLTSSSKMGISLVFGMTVGSLTQVLSEI